MNGDVKDMGASGRPTPDPLGPATLLLVSIAAIVPRLAHIWAPISGWHAWRQADTAAIARNFYRGEMNILYPAVDWSGAGTGYVESEFQLFPFLVALIYQVFGLHVVFGRILAVLFSVGTALYLALLCARYTDRRTAGLAAGAFSLFPINSYIGAAFMPEPLMLFASVAAVYHMDRWSDMGPERDRWISALFLAVAIAVKLPEAFLGMPIAYLVWRRLGWRSITSLRVWLCALVALVPPALWYWHAHQLKEKTGLTFVIWEVGSDKWGNLDLLSSPKFYFDLLFARLMERHLTYAGALLLIIGCVLLRRRKDLGLFKWWTGGAVFYLLLVAKGNAVHDYYQLPVLLPLALGVGAGIAWATERGFKSPGRIVGRFLLAAFLVLSALRNLDLVEKVVDSSPGLLAIGAVAQEVVPPGELVVAVDDGDPTLLYHVDRRGWHASVGMLEEDWIEARRREGAAYLIAAADRFDRPETAPRLERLRERYPDRSTDRAFHFFELRDP